MAISKKTEKSLLDHEEWTLVESTHKPALGLLDEAGLQAARKRLRDLRAKERDLGHEKRRIARGKAEPRGGSFPGTYARPKQRKQVFAHALRRVNDELGRRDAVASRARIVDGQKRALAAKRATTKSRPANRPTARGGVNPVENPKRATKVPGAKIGSVTKRTARSQAKKDA
ncbi:hypothetical protein L6Q21_12085 [Sandaracinobacter sp. RS1-74]|uniref:hypothetical protein n=1 Tax=Sandaracinobacteroides sayramensis TaxID=2913411 RepID=UPI001ED9FAE8|nr:hypothetical protein [Sandaracinobacteroides sayramensis]MCG2841721.1 hypothetical protein [Sandaracinobacteroides sayramensis]